MRKDNSVFKTKFISEPGSFLRNADYFAFVELQDYACYCIADGIDDEKKRQSAQLAVSAVMDRFYSRSGMSKGLMKRYALAAHKELLKESHDIRLEASMLIVVTNYKKIRYVNIGNARLHHIRNNKIINQSKDQSLSQNMAEQGEIPLDMIEEHEERHNLYCYLGQPGRFTPYISPKIKLEDGDIITLCTRGIWENTGVAELLDATEEANEPEDVCTNIEDIILSQRMKWISNYTIACIHINKVYKNPKKEKIIRRVVAICIPIFMLAMILGITMTVRNVKKQNKIKQMWTQIDEGIIDIDKNGKILEETNSLKQGASSYENFQSSNDSKKGIVKAAKPYIEAYNLMQSIQTLEAEDEIAYMDLYKEYARLLGIAKGKKYIEQQLQKGEMEGDDYKISVSESVNFDYLNEEARESFENVIEKYEKNFESVMLNAKLENIYNKIDGQYNKALDNTEDYVKSAKKNLVYNFQNDDILGQNSRDLENYLRKFETSNMLDENLKSKINTLLGKLSEFKNTIIGEAWTDKANAARKKGKYADAMDALDKAQKAYNKAGNSEAANACKNSSSEIQDKVEENKIQKAEANALDVFNQAESLFEAENYEAAKGKYKAAKTKYEKLKNDTKASECREMMQKIDDIIAAKEYEEQAKQAYNSKKYEKAKSLFEKAQALYESAGLTSKSLEIEDKLEIITKKIEKEEEKAKKEKEKKNKEN